MSYTPTRFYGSQPSATGVISAYTVPSGKTAIVKQVVIFNNSSGSVTPWVQLGSVNIIGQSLNGYQTVTLDLAQVLNAGETIQLSTSVANTLNFMISGVVIG